jgi:hypothetical protein
MDIFANDTENLQIHSLLDFDKMSKWHIYPFSIYKEHIVRSEDLIKQALKDTLYTVEILEP